MQKFLNIVIFINLFLIQYTIYRINSSINSLATISSSSLSMIDYSMSRIDKQEATINRLEDILSAINMAKSR